MSNDKWHPAWGIILVAFGAMIALPPVYWAVKNFFIQFGHFFVWWAKYWEYF